jgi:hypothetical protein
MPVAIEMSFESATLDQYDRAMELMGLENGGQAPPGALFHWAAATDSGLRVVDVWESREAFDRFAEEQIGPHTAAAGIEGQPEMTFRDVHGYVRA